jgi:hypothetical protein
MHINYLKLQFIEQQIRNKPFLVLQPQLSNGYVMKEWINWKVINRLPIFIFLDKLNYRTQKIPLKLIFLILIVI